MSDYVSKNKAVESLTKYKFGAISNDVEREYTKEMVLVIANGLPTISETEIIRKAFERVVDKLCDLQPFLTVDGQYVSLYEVVQTIKKECGISE